ncbi:MAG: OmpA family protein [Rhizobiales bacterium]|nr:OmpA family protein [Hyphomicrobiales bacterium]
MNRAVSLASAVALGLAVALSGCSGSSGGGSSGRSTGVTQASLPDTGGIGAEPGTEQDFMLNVGRRTFFKQGSAALDETARVTVDKQAEWLARYPQWKAKIQGFADDSGSEAAQLKLSQQRADAVKNYLVAQGISQDRIWAKGYGRDRLVGDCADLECKAQNRRVVTNLQEPGAD